MAAPALFRFSWFVEPFDLNESMGYKNCMMLI